MDSEGGAGDNLSSGGMDAVSAAEVGGYGLVLFWNYCCRGGWVSGIIE